MPTDKPRYTITLDEEMLKKIDDFRFENRFPNRTQATLELIRLGLEVLEKQQESLSSNKSEKSTNNPTNECTVDELEEEYKKTLHSAHKTNSTVSPIIKSIDENTEENKAI